MREREREGNAKELKKRNSSGAKGEFICSHLHSCSYQEFIKGEFLKLSFAMQRLMFFLRVKCFASSATDEDATGSNTEMKGERERKKRIQKRHLFHCKLCLKLMQNNFTPGICALTPVMIDLNVCECVK